MRLFISTALSTLLIISVSDAILASGKGISQKRMDSLTGEIPTDSSRKSTRLPEKSAEEKSKWQFTSKKSHLNYSAAKKLYESKDKNDKESGRSALCALAYIGRFPSLEAAELLFKSDSEDDKVLGRKALYSIAQKEAVSTLNAKAAELLFKSLELNDKEIGRNVLYDVLRHPEKYYICSNNEGAYEDQLLLELKTANTLIEIGDEKDRKIAMEKINHTYFLASESIGTYREKHQRILGLMGSNSNPLQLAALQTLLRKGDEESRGRAISELLFLAKGGQYKAAQSLATRLNTLDEKAYLEGLKYIAQRVDHPNRYEAAKILYDLRRDYSNDGKNALIEISQQENHPNQNEAKEELKFCTII